MDSITMALEPTRPVGQESRKTYAEKIKNGFFRKFLSGQKVLEIGYRGYLAEEVVPIVPQAIGVDRDYPGYDGVTLPFEDGSIDGIYSSHCFEHIPQGIEVLRDWYRVLRVGGFIVLIVPHQHLFEKKKHWPSLSNPDHAHFYTSGSLLTLIEQAFDPNSYRIRSLIENDDGYDYSLPPGAPCEGSYEIEVVIEKIDKPIWNISDGTVRAYSAAELSTYESRPDSWSIDIDFCNTDRHQVWGPWITLEKGNYAVDFEFEAFGLDEKPLSGSVIFEVSQNGTPIAQVSCEAAVGRDQLRSGKVTIPFAIPDKAIYFEFRVLTYGVPFDGKLRLKGAVLRHSPPA